MRLQETFSEHTRDLAIARVSGAGYLDSSNGGEEKTRAAIRKQLESSSDREKLDAMKRLVAVSHFVMLLNILQNALLG
jgi:AP-3 complex subunit beta